MNRLPAFFNGIACLFLLLLTSCESIGGSSAAEIVYPTADELERMEAQWGLQPRQVKPRPRSYDAETYQAPAKPTTPPPAPAPPQPTPLPETAPPVPPQPSVDAETLQKLR